MKKATLVLALVFTCATMNTFAHKKGEKCKGGKACCKKEMAMKKKATSSKMAMVAKK